MKWVSDEDLKKCVKDVCNSKLSADAKNAVVAINYNTIENNGHNLQQELYDGFIQLLASERFKSYINIMNFTDVNNAIYDVIDSVFTKYNSSNSEETNLFK